MPGLDYHAHGCGSPVWITCASSARNAERTAERNKNAAEQPRRTIAFYFAVQLNAPAAAYGRYPPRRVMIFQLSPYHSETTKCPVADADNTREHLSASTPGNSPCNSVVGRGEESSPFPLLAHRSCGPPFLSSRSIRTDDRRNRHTSETPLLGEFNLGAGTWRRITFSHRASLSNISRPPTMKLAQFRATSPAHVRCNFSLGE